MLISTVHHNFQDLCLFADWEAVIDQLFIGVYRSESSTSSVSGRFSVLVVSSNVDLFAVMSNVLLVGLFL